MSSDAPGGGRDGRGGRRASIGNFVKRFRTVFRRKRSTSEPAQLGESSETGPVVSTAVPAPIEETSFSVEPVQTTAETEPPIAVDPTGEAMRVPLPHSRSAAQQERIRLLFAKYGIEIDPEESMPANIREYPERIHKPIRMRVHRTCHRCKTTFGTDKTCVNCQHRRCTKCPRYPVKKTRKETLSPGATAAGRNDDDEDPPRPPGIRRTRRDDTNIHKPTQQAVGRFCHKCDTQFDPPNQSTCQNCGHSRCTRCLREPTKSRKWPDAYTTVTPDEDGNEPILPDRIYRKPKARVRWYCEKCGQGFFEKSKTCEKCGHERCESCNRMPPKKVRQSVDPELIKAVEAKLALLNADPLTSPTTMTVTVP